jgi:hypothetical protein
VTRRRLPAWLAGGPEVSLLAYRICAEAFGDPPRAPAGYSRDDPGALDMDGLGVGEVVAHLSEVLDADEADICRALAELERAGVLEKASSE